MATDRFVDAGHPAWTTPALVRCPRCDGLAVVTERPRDPRHPQQQPGRLTCETCALVLEAASAELGWGEHAAAAHDAWFGAPLYLQARCCGDHVLWARNRAHLDWLERVIGAGLRASQRTPSGGRPLSTKLPAWLTAAKHRDEVLRQIGRLRATLP
jgi:hypothetical protein